MKKIIIGILAIAMCSSCTNLDEELNDALLSADGVATIDLLSGAYTGLAGLQDERGVLAAYVHSTDELIPPTRGANWDDAGDWRAHHIQEWTNVHPHVFYIWRILNSGSFGAQLVLCAGDGTAEQIAEATFLRVLTDYMTLDLFGKVPRRACGEDLLESPSTLLLRAEGISILIEELEAAVGDLPSGTSPTKANKNAARALLAKMYLNKSVYEATGSDGGALVGPYVFDPTNMTKVIENVDLITGRSLAANYFDNFLPDNANLSDELLFVSENVQGGAGGRLRSRWHMTLNGAHSPGGWNGFTATTDLFNLFEAGDLRLNQVLPEITAGGGGFNAGFLTGAQFDVEGTALTTPQTGPLVYTPDVDLFNSSDDQGYRVIKYAPDYTDLVNPNNDYVFLRYADALLLKAEAILRGGASTETALDIINQIRTIRNATPLATVTLQDVLDERSRELYWEGWRKQDQIRFGTFLDTWQEKANATTAKSLLYPIPAVALASDPNLTQNPGY